MASVCLLRSGLVSLVVLGLVNFGCNLVSRFAFDDLDVETRVFNWILFSTTIVAGMVINLGTVIQIVNELRHRSLAVDFKYTECLMSGCLTLLVAQVHTEFFQILDTVHSPSFNWYVHLATPVTTLMSFVSVTVFHFVTRLVDGCSTGEKCRRRVVFVEGTACIGKTSSSDVSFDFNKFIEQSKLFARKTEEPVIQAIYEINMHAAFLNYLLTMDERSDHFLDRSPVSQLAYALLFRFDGHIDDPHRFMERFDDFVANDVEMITTISIAVRSWYNAVQRMLDKRFNVYFLWYGSIAPTATVERLRSRGGLECNKSNSSWNLLHYTFNQNHVFRRLSEITQIGPYLEVGLLDRDTIVGDTIMCDSIVV